MIIYTIMEKRFAKFLQIEGYKLKVNENKYILFKSKQHFENIDALERKLFDLVNYALFGEDEEIKEYKIFDRMLKIEKYVKKLPYIELTDFDRRYDYFEYDVDEDEDYDLPSEIRFPTLTYFFKIPHIYSDEIHSNFDLFIRKMRIYKTLDKFKKLKKLVGGEIIISELYVE